MVKARAIFMAFLLASCFVPAAFSQTETATISGRVSDPSGAMVSGVEVQLENIDQATVREATTDRDGLYTFPSLSPGQYHMTIKKAGFRQIEVVNVVVNVEDRLEWRSSCRKLPGSERGWLSGASWHADDWRICAILHLPDQGVRAYQHRNRSVFSIATGRRQRPPGALRSGTRITRSGSRVNC